MCRACGLEGFRALGLRLSLNLSIDETASNIDRASLTQISAAAATDPCSRSFLLVKGSRAWHVGFAV